MKASMWKKNNFIKRFLNEIDKLLANLVDHLMLDFAGIQKSAKSFNKLICCINYTSIIWFKFELILKFKRMPKRIIATQRIIISAQRRYKSLGA